MCSEKAELDDTRSGPHVGKDFDKGTCEELDETMSWYATEKSNTLKCVYYFK